MLKIMSIPNSATRDGLGKLFCKGEGIEIGAGTLPTAVARNTIVHYADKRTPEELKSYFSTSDVVKVQSLSLLEGKKFDFLMAHHVLEHSANVIQTLIYWLSLLKDDGILFISLPNMHITPDASRLLTPPTHFLLDYINQTTEDDFESREHICSFLWGWIDVGGLKDKTKLEAAALVAGSLNSGVNDLHWHTFNIDTMKFVVEMAAAFSGRTVEVLFEHDGFPAQSEHRLVCRFLKGFAPISENVAQLRIIRDNLRSIINKVALENLEGRVTYSLSKEHKGKLFLVDHGKLRWILSPKTLEEKGLNGLEYTYLEIGGMEKGIFGPDIGEAGMPDRRGPIHERLRGLEKLPGVELSPGAVPILDKRMFNVFYLDKFDHANSDTYLQGQPVGVDFILGSKLIDEVLEHDKFNYLVSSHVIEHIPDFIQFFKSAARVLKNGAKLIMYVPDKRYTLDVLRSVSGISDIEEAHNQRLRHPSRAMALDVYVNTDFNADTVGLWNKSYTAVRTRVASEATSIVDGLELSTADLHCFTFTPESFRILISHVIAMHVPVFELVEITETSKGHNEFIVDLMLQKTNVSEY